jgi:hypothetical protein
MLVIKNDYLVRIKDNTVFRVLLADAESFAVIRTYFDPKTATWKSDYGTVMAYSNKGNQLEDIGFKLADKKVA